MRLIFVQGRERSNKGRFASRFAVVAAAAVGSLVGIASSASAATPPPVKEANNQFFDWFINETPGYVPSPFLTNSSASSVSAFLEKLPSGSIRAVKITEPISNSTAKLIFNNPKYNVSYVLGDLEMDKAADKMKTLADQVRFIDGKNNGTKTRSYNAFVGNFGFSGLSNDKTLPKKYKAKSKDDHSFAGFSKGDYEKAKLNMSMPELYPGSPSQKSVASGDLNAPNIRSGLFVEPIFRTSQISAELGAKAEVVPYVARFNNWGNLALDTDRNASNGFRFVPGQAIPAKSGLPGFSASETRNQMLSRRDFAAQVAHYRLRGADSFVAFEPGVEGYLNEDKRKDAKAGWTESNIDAIFKANDATLLLGKDSDYKNNNNAKDPNGNIIIDGKERSIEDAGALFSGVYSLTLKKMEVLLSNMDDDDHTLTLPSKIAGFDLKTKSFDLDGGSHLLVEYKLTTSGVNKGWSVAFQPTNFLSGLSNDRSGVGIPEPTMTSLAALAAFGLISRRNRRAGRKVERAAQPIAPRGPMGLVGGNVAF